MDDHPVNPITVIMAVLILAVLLFVGLGSRKESPILNSPTGEQTDGGVFHLENHADRFDDAKCQKHCVSLSYTQSQVSWNGCNCRHQGEAWVRSIN